ncbi:MAG: ABC transporter permease subunit [Chloroflexi bacterium]|nr:ABC transporter permease subunit [Chloroflexota bacterium]
MNLLSWLRKVPLWSGFWYTLGVLYFILPLYATLDFSLRIQRDVISLLAYQNAFADPGFLKTFVYSNILAVITILFSLLLIVPTSYWIRLRLPEARRIVEYVTTLAIVIPAIVMGFGLISVYGAPIKIPFTSIQLTDSLLNSPVGTNFIVVMGYTVLALPLMYRSVDTGMRTIDVRVLTEAAQSLGANWFTIIVRVILPNLRASILSGALLTFAIVVGEVTISSILNVPAFSPYLWLMGQHKAYEPAALSFASFLMIWASMGVIQIVTGGRAQASVAH